MTVETVPPPLPAVPVTTTAEVKAWLGITDTDDDDTFDVIVAVVDDLVRTLRVAERGRGLAVWPARIALGGRMLAGRLYRRRNTPDGIATFTDEGAVYVQRNDPDVALLLELGAHATPAVG